MYPCCMLHCYCNSIASPTSAKLCRWTIRRCSQKALFKTVVYGKVNSGGAYGAQCIYAEKWARNRCCLGAICIRLAESFFDWRPIAIIRIFENSV